MGSQHDRDVVSRCDDGIATQETKLEGPPEMRREWWLNQAEKGGKGGETRWRCGGRGRKRKAAGLFGLAALLEAGVFFAHHGTEAGDFSGVDGGGVGGAVIIGGEE